MKELVLGNGLDSFALKTKQKLNNTQHYFFIFEKHLYNK